ncbi:MAG: hypothetical protein O3C40_36305 [Planctomycetota bacterium]|nr:hypothetical protein [Planctomycetota bacterium]
MLFARVIAAIILKFAQSDGNSPNPICFPNLNSPNPMPQHCRLTFLLLAACLAVLATTASVVAQQSSAGEIRDVTIGFDGTYKVGYWTPVRITIAAGSEDLDGQLALTTKDGDGVPATFLDAEPIHVAANNTSSVTRHIKFGQLGGDLTIALRDAGRPVVRRVIAGSDLPPAMASDRDWILTLGPDVGVTAAAKSSHVTAVTDISTLPTNWFAYEAVNTIVLATSDTSIFASITPEQFAALEQWVELGGRLVLCVGSAAEEVAGSGKPLANLVPGTFSRVQTVRSLTALESYVASSQALDAIQVDGRTVPLKICLLENVVGKMSVYEQAAEGVRPIIVRAPTGLGQVVFMAADLDRSPFSDWADRPRLIERLLQGDAEQRQERSTDSGATGQVVHLGYNDLVGQLRTAAEQFSGVKLIPFSWVAGLIVFYILLMGPVDYFFLRDVLRRMSWTWVTLPIIAVVFCALAVLLRGNLKGSDVKVNQIDLVDIDLERSIARGTTWTHLYSPRSASYDLQLASSRLNTADKAPGCLLSWQGLPGTGLGGLEAKSVTLFDAPYTISHSADASSIKQAPIEIDGTKAFIARWWNEVQLESTADLHLDAGGLLRGNVVNPLSVELNDCILLYGNWAYKLERKGNVLQPGDATPIHLEKPLNFNWRLTRRRVVEIKDITAPWEQRDLDVPRILEMMMFHGVAGGDKYTHLQHRFQTYVDLSGHLANGRAILFGRAEQSATKIELNGPASGENHHQRWTFYRVVFPVDASPANSSR